MKILAFGEVLWDVYPDNAYIGGAPLNFASHFVKCGGRASVLTAVGNDELGDKTLDEIEKLFVDTSCVFRVDSETGKCLVTLDENHIPSYNLLDDVAYDYIPVPDLGSQKYDVLYFGSLSLRNDNNRKTLKNIICENNFSDIFVDINIRAPFYNEDVVKFAFENASIIKISDEELPVVMELLGKNIGDLKNIAKEVANDFKNLKLIIITKGEKGSFVYDCKNDKSYECASEKVNVVSTVGAGDSFSASFLVKYKSTGDIQASLEFASRISAYVVSCKGAIPKYDVKNFI